MGNSKSGFPKPCLNPNGAVYTKTGGDDFVQLSCGIIIPYSKTLLEVPFQNVCGHEPYNLEKIPLWISSIAK